MAAIPPAESETQTIARRLAAVTGAPPLLQRWARGALIALLYLGAYVVLEFTSDVHSVQGTAITAWSPGIAIMVAVVMHFGVRIAPVTILAPWLSDIVTRHADPFGVPALAEIVSIGCTFTAAGLLLRRLLPGDRVTTIWGFALLLTIMALSALVDASSYSAALIASGHLSAGTIISAATTAWIGDINGIVTVLPLLLLMRTGSGLRLSQVRGHLGLVSLQFLALAASYVVVFDWAGNGRLHLFYLLFLPINWIALRWGAGVTAVTLVALQAAMVPVLAGYEAPQSALAVQLLMVALAATGFFMGIAVSENARIARLMQTKDERIAQLNRLTSITEFTAAVAHELNNPLSALQNYVRAAFLQIRQPGIEIGAVEATLDKALGEANRAATVLRRLRAFFRSGSVQKELADARALVTEAMVTLEQRFLHENILCTIDAPPTLPEFEVDKLQLSVVLHNLLSNACDAIRSSGAGRGRIVIGIQQLDDSLQFEVADTGRGVPPSEVPLLFQPLATDKPLGMGLGLAISRALLEANNGRIWLASSGPSGTRFAFRIPLEGVSHAI